VYSVLQRLASLEGRIVGGSDRDGVTGLRVAAGTGGALAHLEGTEANQRHRVALLQRLGDRADHRIHGAGGLSLGEVGYLGDGFNQFGFIHAYVLPVRPRREMVTGPARPRRTCPMFGSAVQPDSAGGCARYTGRHPMRQAGNPAVAGFSPRSSALSA